MSSDERLRHTPTQEWRCFHCGDVFRNEDDARDHFGPDTEWQPGCIDPLTKDEKARRHDQIAMFRELDRERDENSRLTNRDYVLSCYERDLAKMFGGAKSVTQAYLVFDSMEGRALAAEERVERLTARVAELTELLLQSKAAMLETRTASIVGAKEGYGKPEEWGERLYVSHGGLTRAMKAIDAALSAADDAKET